MTPYGTTICADTPENWAIFRRLKAQLTGEKPPRPVNLSQQISLENKRLRSLRVFLPGHEPDR